MGTNGEAIRALLSHEINELRKLPNVRIITTSRVTQSAYYASNFTRVHLNGLGEFISLIALLIHFLNSRRDKEKVSFCT